MKKVYLDLPPDYEYSTLKKWGLEHTRSKALESPDGKYLCAITSISTVWNGVDNGYFTLFENKPTQKLIFEHTIDSIFYESEYPSFTHDGKLLLHTLLMHRFSGMLIRSFFVIDPENRTFALIPLRDGGDSGYHCDRLEHIGDGKYLSLPGEVKFDIDKLTYYPLEKLNDLTDVDIPRFRFGAVEPIPNFPKRKPIIIPYLFRQYQLHKSLTVTDVLKQCYQAAYGAEHLLTDKEAARRYLEREFEATPAKDVLICEHISDDFCRVNIAAWKHRGLPADDLFELFEASAYPRKNGRELLEGFLHEAEGFTDHRDMTMKRTHGTKAPSFDRINTFSQNAREIIEEYRRAGMPAIHHSDAYREAEHPAYRVVESKLLREYFEKKH